MRENVTDVWSIAIGFSNVQKSFTNRKYRYFNDMFQLGYFLFGNV